MSAQTEKPQKIGTEITVRISLTFQEAPDVHTLLAMTPVRERGRLVRLALERYIAETGHPAGDVDQQIRAISTWLRSRTSRPEATGFVANQLEVDCSFDAEGALQVQDAQARLLPHSGLSTREIGRSDPVSEGEGATPSSIKRWLQV